LADNQWAKGLPLLAKASPGKLKALATMERSDPRNTTERVEIADGWWDLAETEKGKRKSNVRRHAAYWYQQASAGLDGLALAEAKQLVRQVFMEMLPDPATFRYSEHSWSAGKPFVDLVPNARGFAFLSGAGGNFQGGAEWLHVRLNPNGFWR